MDTKHDAEIKLEQGLGRIIIDSYQDQVVIVLSREGMARVWRNGTLMGGLTFHCPSCDMHADACKENENV